MVRLPQYLVPVRVRDALGRPVAGAAIDVQPGPLDSAVRTGRDGTATLQIPEEMEVDTVLAFKDLVGLDYFENYRSWPPGKALVRLPPEIDLVLGGAREVSVRAVDSLGNPVAGVLFSPGRSRRKASWPTSTAPGADRPSPPQTTTG